MKLPRRNSAADEAGRRIAVGRWAFGAALGVLSLVALAPAEDAPAVPAAPPLRRVRRRYDAVVRLHEPGEVQKLPETEKTPAAPRPSEDEPRPLGEISVTGWRPLSAPAVRLKRPEDKEESEKSDLWVITPVADLLGVTLTGANAVVKTDWGWLADEIRGAMGPNRAPRTAGKSVKAPENEEETEEASEVEEPIYRPPPPIMYPSSSMPESRADWRVADTARYNIQLTPSVNAPALPPLPAATSAADRGGGASSESNAASGGRGYGVDPNMGSARTETPPSNAQRDFEELRAAHRMESLVPSVGSGAVGDSPSAPGDGVSRWATGALRSPLENMKPIAAPSAPAPERPLLTGSPDNYGRRGDIFSSGFRTSSSDSFPSLAASEPSFSYRDASTGSAGSSSSPSSSPSFSPSYRPWGSSAYDPLKPFDPSGRALTEPRTRW